MAERKQVNKYYPPDFDPRKHKNLDKYNNTHALRERAKKIDQGILVIRFEMPYDIWCEGCKIHIAMGVRYNAEKRKVGYYYSTPIYRFRMKCHLCENYFEIETDPKNCNYNILIGAQRKNEKWDMAENEQVLTEDRQVVKKLAADAMFKLEHGVEDKKKLQKVAPTLSELVDVQSGWGDDYMQNRMLRAKFRKEKKELQLEASKDKALLEKSSLEIKLLPETEDDKKLASLLKYRSVDSFDERQQKKRTEIQTQSIFNKPSESKLSPGKQLDDNTVKLSRLNKQLELAKKSNPAGFSVFDEDSRKRRMKSAPVVVRKRRSGVRIINAAIEDGVDAEEKDHPLLSYQERLTTPSDLSSSYHRNDEDGTSPRENNDNFQRTLNHSDHLPSSLSNSDTVILDESGNGQSSRVELLDGRDINDRGVKSTEEEPPVDTWQQNTGQNGNMSLVGDYVTSSSESE